MIRASTCDLTSPETSFVLQGGNPFFLLLAGLRDCGLDAHFSRPQLGPDDRELRLGVDLRLAGGRGGFGPQLGPLRFQRSDFLIELVLHRGNRR